MLARTATLAAILSLVVPVPGNARPAGGYLFDGGSKSERETVTAALNASTFDWSRVPGPITIHIVRGGPSRAIPHEIWLDADLLDAGEFSWGTVQHEYAHQVDFLLLDDEQRATLLHELGGRDWCYGVPGLRHEQYGCERFASTLAWSFWPSPNNSLRPAGPQDESAAMAPAKFRKLVATLTGLPLSRRARSR
jgi:hypothetical protein